jgi:NADH dehydrogenase/NADH:ubiquinone oxidoreductase subunit G
MSSMTESNARWEREREQAEAEAAERERLHAQEIEEAGGTVDEERLRSRGKGVEVLAAERSPVEEQQRRAVANRTEQDMVDGMRQNASRATEIETDLLERALTVKDKDLPSALRAVADVKAKNLDGLLKMTGRAPAEDGGSIAQTLRALAKDGLVRLHVDLDVGQPDS